jgi:hypothetical protein
MEEHKLTLDKIVKQTASVDELLRRAFKLHRDGDRVPFVLQGRARFQAGATQTSEMVFNVPTDADFEGEYMNLYLGARVISLNPSERPSENAFRPVDWFYSSSPAFVQGKAGALFELRDSINGPYQNVAIAMPSAFSGAVSAPMLACGLPQYPGALAFHVPYQLKRGSTMTCRITPVQTATITSIDDGAVPLESYETVEFEVTGLVHGYKRTYGFK